MSAKLIPYLPLAQFDGPSRPFLTVAIPHYRHREYLELVLNSILDQDYDDYEIVISDDCSPDDSRTVIPPILKAAGKPYRYYLQSANLGYDGNVRFCLAAAKGRYVFLLGNDDALDNPTTLRSIADALRGLDLPAVAFTNFRDWATGAVTRRAVATQILGHGIDAAIAFYRSFSFVSGLVFEQTQAAEHETDRWDQSIYYQIYLATRIVGAGGNLASIDLCSVRKDVRLDGRGVPNYASKWIDAPWSFQPRNTGLESVIRVAVDGVAPYVGEPAYSPLVRKIIFQMYAITYVFWLFEYRQVANWSFAAGIARSLWLGHLLAEYRLRWRDRMILWAVYLGATAAGLFVPIAVFNALKFRLAHLVRARLQLRRGAK